MNKEVSCPLIVPLDKSEHNRNDFDCGIPELDIFLKQQAAQKDRDHKAKTYVALANDGKTIMGYFTLAMVRLEWHENIGNKYRQIDTAPIIARLAVDKRYQRRGLGSYLLLKAFEKLIAANKLISHPVIIVDAKDGSEEFYKKFGFQRLGNEGQRLFLLMETLLQSQAG